MKINEFNTPTQLNEGPVWAAVKGAFSGQGTRQTRAQDIFIKDFVQDAITSVNNGLKGGWIDKNIKGISAGTTPAVSSPAGKPAVSTPASGSAAQAQRQTNQTINNYIKQAAQTLNQTTDKNEKIALTKELVNAMADRQGSSEWNNALGTVQQVIKRGGVDPNFATSAINNLKAGKTMSESWRINAVNLLLEAVDLTWEDLGLSVLTEGADYYIAESKYVKLDAIFESIVREADNAKGISLSDFLLDWFKQYMTGVEWSRANDFVKKKLTDMEAEYPSNFKKNLTDLATVALSLSKAGSPAGAPAQFKQANAEAGKDADQLKAAITDYSKTDPAGYNELIKGLRPATVSEGKRRR